jgi:hypothetical protein
MNNINNDRRFSHPNVVMNFSKFIHNYINSKPKPLANNIRTKLLLFSNKEFNEYKKKDKSLINHLSIKDAEKKYYNDTIINLKPKTYSQFFLISRGEGKSSLNIMHHPQTFTIKDVFIFSKNYIKIFKRKSLAEKKIMRFKTIINNMQDLNSSLMNEISTSASVSPSQNLNQTFVIKGMKYLRELAFAFKEINKKKKKKRHSVFVQGNFNFGKIKGIE